jgi:hypothetical protein
MMLITVIAGTLILAVHLQYRLIRRDANRIQAFYLAEAAIYRSLNENPQQPVDSAAPKIYQYPDWGSATVETRLWGGFLRLVSIAEHKNSRSGVQALVGQQIPPVLDAAVRIHNIKYPLVLAGETGIRGQVHTGKNGLRNAKLDREPFTGRAIPQDSVIEHNHSPFPLFDTDLIQASMDRIRQLGHRRDAEKIYRSIVIDSTNKGLLNRSLLVIYGDLTITGLPEQTVVVGCSVYVRGRIHIDSDIRFGPWTVLAAEKTVHLRQCRLSRSIVYAQKQISTSGLDESDVQLLSRSGVRVEASYLSWPSLIYVDARYTSTQPLVITAGSTISGSVLIEPAPDALLSHGRQRSVLQANSHVHGVLWSPGWIDLAGSVSGCVAVGCFYLYVSPTTYLNWLYNATIDRTALEPDFIVPIGFGKEPRYRVISMDCRPQTM